MPSRPTQKTYLAILLLFLAAVSPSVLFSLSDNEWTFATYRFKPLGTVGLVVYAVALIAFCIFGAEWHKKTAGKSVLYATAVTFVMSIIILPIFQTASMVITYADIASPREVVRDCLMSTGGMASQIVIGALMTTLVMVVSWVWHAEEETAVEAARTRTSGPDLQRVGSHLIIQ